MSTGSGSEALVAQGDELAEAYAQMRADTQTQFAPVEMPAPENSEPPQWLKDLLEWLGDLFKPVAQGLVEGWPVIKWVLIALGVALLVFLLWRLFAPDLFARRSRTATPQDDWVPDSRAALALLEDADRLAAEGRFDEATHLLLQRSVGQIATARPDLVDPSSTARELAAEPALPEGARKAFGVIAQRVERSLFALQHLGQDDWQAARDAYAEFALARLTGSAL
ncbi:hypothetical protein [Aurantiacibacter xanthus]|uniref:hypothetical protein n=1 Tax=Aurantiacibacter xanthus TaxID=1784712 RepID=UPI00174D256C|nr:hypothetical protein [Aurantiacibacter xanthus]